MCRCTGDFWTSSNINYIYPYTQNFMGNGLTLQQCKAWALSMPSWPIVPYCRAAPCYHRWLCNKLCLCLCGAAVYVRMSSQPAGSQQALQRVNFCTVCTCRRVSLQERTRLP